MSGLYVNSVQVPLSKSRNKKLAEKASAFSTPHQEDIIISKKHRMFLHPTDAQDKVDISNIPDIQVTRINVGGTIFETLETTLQRIPGSRLAQLNYRSPYYRTEMKAYFFDRDPEIFKSVLNYHRIGELHLPLHICGPLLEKELEYWGMPEQIIEKCCWIHYIQLKSQKYSLVDFENFFSEYESDEEMTKCHMWSQYLWKMFNKPSSSPIAMVYAIVASLFVIMSIFVFVAESHSNFQVPSSNMSILERSTQFISSESHETSTWKSLTYIDLCCLIFFSADLTLRFFSTPNRVKFLTNVITIIEIISVFPYYIDIFGHYIETLYKVDLSSFLKIVHILRIFGVLRIFKILRYYSGLQVLVYTLRSSYKDLLLMLTFIGVATLFFSTLIYHLDDRSVFTSIPAGFWWAIITMTTVGYGDIYPKFLGGYIVGGACSLVGVLVVAFTVPILVNSFMLYYSHAQSMMMVRDENHLDAMTEDERVYLNHTFNTLKRMSFYSFLPDFNHQHHQPDTSLSSNIRRTSPVGQCADNGVLYHNQLTKNLTNQDGSSL